ncbi:MAG TPA: gamma-glutamyltransferase [Microvirga sp.]|jgi:gamma-glutamyltranspeptidase/glutathione hydrolase|nr:gamma-glutamyltransferase [Microvirga sp.]
MEVHLGDGSFRTQAWHVTKPAAAGSGGVVVAQSREAAQAGVAILEAGGNAADAVVATAFALAAVEPWNSGLGGVGFAVVVGATEDQGQVVDFGPIAPRRANPADYPLTGRTSRDLFAWPEVKDARNVHGSLSFCLPSAVAGYGELWRRFGSGMPLEELLAPAIALARRGLPQDWFTTLKVSNAAPYLRLYDETARIYLRDGLPPVPPYQGAPGFFPLGRLGATLEHLASAGLADFYQGDLAASLVADVRALGGVLDETDLAACQALVGTAPVIDWRGRYLIHTAGGLTAAPTLEAVVRDMGDGPPPQEKPDPAWFAQLSRAMRSAYARRLSELGAAGTPREPADACTTHVSAVDGAGNLVSLTTTLLSSMGSCVVLPGTGVLMNNGMMWFDPRPDSPNAIAPGARPLCNMCPVIVTPVGGGWPRVAAGASGGRRILASVYQTLAFALDFNMSAGAAAHHPRIDVSGPDITHVDRDLPPSVIEALRADGPVEVVERSVLPINFACPNHVRAEDGWAEGCSDVGSPWSGAVTAVAPTAARRRPAPDSDHRPSRLGRQDLTS